MTDGKHGKKITVHGKTGSRTILLVKSVPYLSKWLNHHPLRDNPYAPLWCAIDAPHRGLHAGDVAFMLRELQRRMGIQKKLHLHVFRHAMATYLAKYFPDAQMKTFSVGQRRQTCSPFTYTLQDETIIVRDSNRLVLSTLKTL